MKRFAAALMCLCIIFTAFPAFANNTSDRVILYVAPSGSDLGSGAIDAPLKSLTAARDKIRQMKKSGVNPSKGFVVYLRGGDHLMLESLVLTEEDSGTAEAPIVYRAYPGEKVALVGGASLPGNSFKKVTDESILNRVIEESARDKIMVADLHALGFNEFGEPFWPGAYSYSMKWIEKPKAASPELFIDGELQTLARYPNDGYMTISTVVDPGAHPRMWEPDKKSTADYVQPADQDQNDTFEITPDDDRYKKWTTVPENSALMYGFWQWDWADHTVPLKKVYLNESKLESTVPSWYSVKKGGRFYVFNLLEEIDSPGEYFLDRENGKLYIYPPKDLAAADIKFSILEDNLIQINGANYNMFENLNITAARNSAVYIEKGTGNVIRNCEISYTAYYGVCIVGKEVFKNGVVDCYIHDVNGGVYLETGDRETLTKSDCYVINCEIGNFARINKTYRGAVDCIGCGNIVMHNEMYGAVHLAIQFNGNEHTISYNDIHDVVQSNDDMGAIYGGRSWSQRGNKISYNYIHDLKSDIEGAIGVFGIYLDDRLCDVEMIGNVFSDITGGGIFINGGRDNVVYNNLMVNVSKSFKLRSIIPTDPEGDLTNLMRTLSEVPYQNDLWKSMYPEMYNILEEDASWPVNNYIKNNVSVSCGESEIYPLFYERSDIEDVHHFSSVNFYDADKEIFLIDEKSEVFEKHPDFHQLPITRMGTYSDRAKSRVKNAVCMSVGSPSVLNKGTQTQLDKTNASVVPVIRNSRTFVPLRFLSESFGMDVEYNDRTREISISGGSIMLKLNPGSNVVVKNGEEITIDAAPYIENGRTMVPLRAVTEMFSKQVFWDDCGLIIVSDTENLINPEADKNIVDYLYNYINIY